MNKIKNVTIFLRKQKEGRVLYAWTMSAGLMGNMDYANFPTKQRKNWLVNSMAKGPSMSTNLMTWDPHYLIKHCPAHVAIKPWNMTKSVRDWVFYLFSFNFKHDQLQLLEKIKYV